MQCQQTYRDTDQNGSGNHGLESCNDKLGVIQQSGGECIEDQY